MGTSHLNMKISDGASSFLEPMRATTSDKVDRAATESGLGVMTTKPTRIASARTTMTTFGMRRRWTVTRTRTTLTVAVHSKVKTRG